MSASQKLPFRSYIFIFLVYGLLCCCVPIIITEILWDAAANAIGLSGLLRDILADFFRAALLEEGFKLLGFLGADRKYRFSRRTQAMFAAGTVGMAYLLVEKLFAGNAMSLIMGVVFPMHLWWQMNQGRRYVAWRQAKAREDRPAARRELFQWLPLPFLLHGCWDAALDLGSHFADLPDAPALNVVGVVLLGLVIAFGVYYTVFTIKRTMAAVRQDRREAEENGALDSLPPLEYNENGENETQIGGEETEMNLGRKITSFSIVTLHTSGMRFVEEQEIVMKDGMAQVSQYGLRFSQGEKQRILEAQALCSEERVLKLLNDCRLLSWDGFCGKHPKGVLDGTMFRLEATVNGDQKITAHGSQNFPRHYRDFTDGLYGILHEQKDDGESE